jgi:hypothetical protein
VSAGRQRVACLQPTEIELGDQLWDQSVPFELAFVNHTSGAVRNLSVDAARGCTVLDKRALEGRLIAPGEVVHMAESLNTGRNPGRQRHSVTVRMDVGGARPWQRSLSTSSARGA